MKRFVLVILLLVCLSVDAYAFNEFWVDSSKLSSYGGKSFDSTGLDRTDYNGWPMAGPEMMMHYRDRREEFNSYLLLKFDIPLEFDYPTTEEMDSSPDPWWYSVDPISLTPGSYELESLFLEWSEVPDPSRNRTGSIDVYGGNVSVWGETVEHYDYINLSFDFGFFEDGDPNKWVIGGFNTEARIKEATATPEPATILLFSTGLLGMALRKRKKAY